MPVCEVCHTEIVYGPAGCRCTQASKAEPEPLTREQVDALYEAATHMSQTLGTGDPPVPTESCQKCGRTRYGWCPCIL